MEESQAIRNTANPAFLRQPRSGMGKPVRSTEGPRRRPMTSSTETAHTGKTARNC